MEALPARERENENWGGGGGRGGGGGGGRGGGGGGGGLLGLRCLENVAICACWGGTPSRAGFEVVHSRVDRGGGKCVVEGERRGTGGEEEATGIDYYRRGGYRSGMGNNVV